VLYRNAFVSQVLIRETDFLDLVLYICGQRVGECDICTRKGMIRVLRGEYLEERIFSSGLLQSHLDQKLVKTRIAA